MFGQYFIQDDCADRDGYYSVGEDYLCEIDYDVSVEDNFSGHSIYHSGVFKGSLMVLSSLFIVCFGFGLKCFRDVNDKYFIFVGMFFLSNMLELGFQFHSELETCSFPRWCHEGINNTIVPSYYYFQRKECPRINAWIPDYYEDRLGTGDIDCDKTEYGCCEIREISCESSFREGDSYSFYKYIEDRNVGHWTLNIEKVNEKGDNCPTIEEMILEISDEKSTFKVTGIIVFINCILTLIVYLVFLNCIAGKYENVDTDDNGEKKDEENPVLSQRNQILVGSA
jgi:hypothetical protein